MRGTLFTCLFLALFSITIQDSILLRIDEFIEQVTSGNQPINAEFKIELFKHLQIFNHVVSQKK